jgi:hypothetical protein
MKTRCYLCNSGNVAPLPFDQPETVKSPQTGEVLRFGSWVRCKDCGSDTNDIDYRPWNYTPALVPLHSANGGGDLQQEVNLSYNCDLFDKYAEELPDKTFLDVGCCDGAGLRAMAKRGWAVHGFDVFEPPYMGPHVTVSPLFHRWLFPRKYSAVMCREVIEHVLYPEMMFRELLGVCEVGGVVQLQTPTPLDALTWAHVYQEPHLCILSPKWIDGILATMPVEVLERMQWEGGQLVMFRRVG